MIIRVYRATAMPGRESEVAAELRRSMVTVRAAEGCVRVEAGHRLLGRSLEFIVVSLWRDLASIEAFGNGKDESFFPDRMAGLVSGAQVEHFEGIEGE